MAFPNNLNVSFVADGISPAFLAIQLLGDATYNHPTEHVNLADEFVAVRAKVGVDNSAVDTSLDYFARNHVHQGTIGGWTDSPLDHTLSIMWSDIQGGTTDEYYHLTAAEHTALTGSLWVLAGDSGTQNVALGDTATIAGTAPISTVAGATRKVTVSHDNSGVSASTYGSANEIPVFAVNATGHITSVTNTSVGSLDWDTVWSDAVHDHSSPGEGGTLPSTSFTGALFALAGDNSTTGSISRGGTLSALGLTGIVLRIIGGDTITGYGGRLQGGSDSTGATISSTSSAAPTVLYTFGSFSVDVSDPAKNGTIQINGHATVQGGATSQQVTVFLQYAKPATPSTWVDFTLSGATAPFTTGDRITLPLNGSIAVTNGEEGNWNFRVVGFCASTGDGVYESSKLNVHWVPA